MAWATSAGGGGGVALGDSPSWTGQHDWKYAGVPVNFQNTTDAVSNQVAIFSAGNRATPADNDQGYLSFYGDDDTGTQVEFARMIWEMDDVTSTSKDSTLRFFTQTGNTMDSGMYLTGDNLTVQGKINAGSFGIIYGDSSIEGAGQGYQFMAGGNTYSTTDSNYLFGSGTETRGFHNFGARGVGATGSNESVAKVLIPSNAITESSSGNHPLFSSLVIKPMTINSGSATVSDTATVYIEGSAASTVVTGQNYALWVDGAEEISRIDGTLLIGATSTSPFKLAVQGSALADDWLTYSPMSDKTDATNEIKNIKCETGTTKNGWCDIDHISLPLGVRVQAPYKVKELKGYKPTIMVDEWNEETKATNTVEWAQPIYEEKEVMGDYMSMTKLTAMLVQSTQELSVRIDDLEKMDLGSINSKGDFDTLKEEIKNELKPDIQLMVDEAVNKKLDEINLWELIKLKVFKL